MLYQSDDPQLSQQLIETDAEKTTERYAPKREVEIDPDVQQYVTSGSAVVADKPTISYTRPTRSQPGTLNWVATPQEWGIVVGEPSLFTVEVVLTRSPESQWAFPDPDKITIALDLNGLVDKVETLASHYLPGRFAIFLRSTFWGRVKSDIRGSQLVVRVYLPEFTDDGYLRMNTLVQWLFTAPSIAFSYSPVYAADNSESEISSDELEVRLSESSWSEVACEERG